MNKSPALHLSLHLNVPMSSRSLCWHLNSEHRNRDDIRAATNAMQGSYSYELRVPSTERRPVAGSYLPITITITANY